MRINGNVIGANNRPTSNTANGVWRWDASTMHRLYNQFPSYSAPPAPPSSTQAQGSTSGYSSGGSTPSADANINKFPFASNANATDVGDLSDARGEGAGQSSTTSGYTSGGYRSDPLTTRNTIDKFPFASNANATDVGDLSQRRQRPAGQSSTASGYSSGGSFASANQNTIDKFPFASNANATDVGDLSVLRDRVAGQSSSTDGYTSGGQATPAPPAFTPSNVIDKFPFATNANATDVGDLTSPERRWAAGQNSAENGYNSGGFVDPPIVNTIDKFPFASNANATDVGDLTVGRYSSASQSSTASGYTSGGNPIVNTIDKFPFASDANASDVGDLTSTRRRSAGQQV